MNPNVKAAEKLALLAALNPQTVVNVEKFSGVADLASFHQVLGVVQLGDMAAEDITVKAYRCDADGSNAVALKSADVLAAHATANDNKQIIINIRATELNESSARYVKLGVVTSADAGGTVSGLILGVDARFEPAAALNAASVKQVVL